MGLNPICRLIPAAVALAVIVLMVRAFLPQAVEVERAAVASPTLEVAVEEEGEAKLREDRVPAIPVGALFRDGAVWASCVIQDGRATLRRITLSEGNGVFAQEPDGLTGGDQFIPHPSDQVVDGVAVTEIAGRSAHP